MNHTKTRPQQEQALRDNLRRRKAQDDQHLSIKNTPKNEIIQITGGQQLNGSIDISGAKNATLPMMVAALLTDQTITLNNIPNLTDTIILAQLLEALGAHISHDQKNKTLRLTAKNITSTDAPHHLVAKMRASFWIIGPLVARTGRAQVPLPGGDAIGARPVEIYLKGLRALGADVELQQQRVHVRAPKGLTGNRFRLAFPSVGATHMMMMAASLAKGQTRIDNAAREPEIIALANMLGKMGATINGAGQNTIYIQGQSQLAAAENIVPSDRIEAATYAIAAAATGGSVSLTNAPIGDMEAIISALQQAGVKIEKNEKNNDTLTISRPHGEALKPVNIATAPYPGFPTDLQAQFMTLMTQAHGSSHITETIFENRFQHVAELQKLGAHIDFKPQQKRETAHIIGPAPLKGEHVSATDLRASVSLVIAALIARGQTTIHNIYHLDRGFETIEDKLSQCGALIKRVPAEKNETDREIER